MKIVTFYPNTADNLHCLQAVVKSILSYYFPEQTFTDELIDQKTLQQGWWTWLPPVAEWLDDLGLEVELYSPFDYGRLAEEGIEYIKEFKKEAFEAEERSGSYKNISEIQQSTKKIVHRKLWKNELLSSNRLAQLLASKSSLAIGKTLYEWVEGIANPTTMTSHYVLLIKEYDLAKWRVHDPGLPGKPDRKIAKTLNGTPIFGDILVIHGLKSSLK